MKKESYSDEISDYLRKNAKKGYTLDSLRWALINQGHSKIEVDKAIKKVQIEIARSAPVLPKPEPTMEIMDDVSAPPAEEKKSFWKKLFEK